MAILAEPARVINGSTRSQPVILGGGVICHPTPIGRARGRQLKRKNKKRWLGDVVRLFAASWLLFGMLMPVILYRSSITEAAPDNSTWTQRSAAPKTGSTAVSAGIPLLTPTLTTPIPTATATPAPTSAPTSTPLPAHLVQATAWQATLEMAASYSYATQTQAAGQYSATQTAIPPILTANALDRAATSTAATR